MNPHHYEIQSDDGRTIVFVCPVDTCRRRVVLRRGDPRPTVIDSGDFFAQHVGGVGPVMFGLRVDPS